MSEWYVLNDNNKTATEGCCRQCLLEGVQQGHSQCFSPIGHDKIADAYESDKVSLTYTEREEIERSGYSIIDGDSFNNLL